jgi:3-hydroxybutyryl-CoA dehydrogenase
VPRPRAGSASATDVLALITVEPDLDPLADRDVVVEAIVEEKWSKVALFKRLDEVVETPDAILASNTSSIPIMKLGVATSRPAQ